MRSGLRHRLRSTSLFALTLLTSWTLAGCHLWTDEDPKIRNVIVVSLDTLGAKRASAYGHTRDTTPNLDRLAAEGTLFENAYTPQVWTMTAHISMMSGLYPLAHGAAKQRRVSPAAPALPLILAENGFTTAAFMGTAGFADRTYGLGRGFDTFRTGKTNAPVDNEPLFAWLEEQREIQRKDPDAKFFLLAHYYDVHSEHRGEVPYDAPEAYRDRYLPDGLNWSRSGSTKLLMQLEKTGTTPEDREVIGALFDAGVRFTDEEGLGALVDKLAALGLLDETLLIVTSDHGEEIFEHGGALHAQPYEEAARVPLVLRGPGIPAGRRVDTLVELVDLMPTVLSLLDLPTPEQVQGHDLTPLLKDGGGIPRAQAHVSGLFGAVPPFLMHKQSNLIREIDGVRWSYVNTVYPKAEEGARVFETRGTGELYRLDDDPDQRTNLALKHAEITRELEAALLAWYADNEALAVELGQAQTWKKPKLNKRQRARLRALGYAE